MGGAEVVEPGDEIAGAGGDSRLIASQADREQVLDALKAAFVQGRLTKAEFDHRIGQALASYAELDALAGDYCSPGFSRFFHGSLRRAPADGFRKCRHLAKQNGIAAPGTSRPGRTTPAD